MKIIGVESVQVELKNISSKLPKAIQNAIKKVIDIGYNTAKDTLKATDHAQKYGDELVDEIGKEVIGNTGRVYAPITKTPKCINRCIMQSLGQELLQIVQLNSFLHLI